ncbi:hypothetical protein DICVIV_11175 [Dictyocaulus viviparus]|uniref:Protein kinase domain-containing protein n=1 Tax=Dictyocaulus viviparus TaxID=29172 RepID=A0A0D8XDW8_DICVI|nr:hypothetical protein DICVIV_11175 [Dictyocaulus viviparus]
MSSRSLQNSIASSSRVTIDSKKVRTKDFNNYEDTQHQAFYVFGEEFVVARKHAARLTLTKADNLMLRKMRNIDHDNLCRFIGLSVDGPQILSVWKYCARKSLKEILGKSAIQMDWFIKYSFIYDICEIKVTFFGLNAIKATEIREPMDNLWLAPEHIRDPLLPPTKEGDIYSFAIICSEIITWKSAWDLENQDYDINGNLI